MLYSGIWKLYLHFFFFFFFSGVSTVWNGFNELLNITTSKLLALWGWHYSSQQMSCPNTVFLCIRVPSAQQKTRQNILSSIAAHIGYTKGQDIHLTGKHKNKYIKISLVSDTFMMIAQWDPTRNCRNYTVYIHIIFMPSKTFLFCFKAEYYHIFFCSTDDTSKDVNSKYLRLSIKK